MYLTKIIKDIANLICKSLKNAVVKAVDKKGDVNDKTID